MFVPPPRVRRRNSTFLRQAFAAMLVLAIILVVEGLVLMILWNWFIPEIFSYGPKLNFGEAVGIGLVVDALVAWPQARNSDLTIFEMLAVGLGELALKAVPLLAVGLIVHSAIS